jgi:predicted nucleic acid-binding protein
MDLTWGLGAACPQPERSFMADDKVFVDTNILVYAYDSSAGDKHKIAQKEICGLWDSGLGLVSTQVLQEFYVCLTKKVPRPIDPGKARDIIQDLLQWKVIINDGPSILEAIDLQTKHRLGFWDALILQAAVKGGAGILLSEDFESGRLIGRVRFRNPFLG